MITVVGIGPGTLEYIPPVALKAIEKADVLVGGERALGLFPSPKKKIAIQTLFIRETLRYLEENSEKEEIAVLVSGDPGLFSFLKVIKRELPASKIKVIPGISSAQLLAARILESWEDVKFLSVHGRDNQELASAVEQNKKVCLFTDAHTSFSELAHMLQSLGRETEIVVARNLGYEDEQLLRVDIDDLETLKAENLSLVYIQHS